MPEANRRIVMDTSPLLALCAACGDFSVLRTIYDSAIVPYEVGEEIRQGGSSGFARSEFEADQWLDKLPVPTTLPLFLRSAIDLGEASVIQVALERGIQRIAIDERNGRRVARTCGLFVTGSLGILVKAKTAGYPVDLREAISRMRQHGIWLSEGVAAEAIRLAGNAIVPGPPLPGGED
jgi:predicted nucleic acid-binding protein